MTGPVADTSCKCDCVRGGVLEFTPITLSQSCTIRFPCHTLSFVSELLCALDKSSHTLVLGSSVPRKAHRVMSMSTITKVISHFFCYYCNDNDNMNYNYNYNYNCFFVFSLVFFIFPVRIMIVCFFFLFSSNLRTRAHGKDSSADGDCSRIPATTSIAAGFRDRW